MDDFGFLKKGPILFIGCHPDDVELGCGGTIHRMIKHFSVYVITLSKNEQNPLNKNLVKEHKKSLKTLGVKESNIVLGDFTTRNFSSSRQEILDFLIKLNNKIQPTCIFTHSPDTHQDHKVCNDESIRAFWGRSLIEYFLPRSMFNFSPKLFIKLSKNDLDYKLKSLSHFKTYKNKNYFSKTSTITHSQFWGMRNQIPLSEAFSPASIII
jgi:LmbE family N-acetylglucosaminyl deacetylase